MTDLPTALAQLREMAHEFNDDDQVHEGGLTGEGLRVILEALEGIEFVPRLK